VPNCAFNSSSVMMCLAMSRLGQCVGHRQSADHLNDGRGYFWSAAKLRL